MLEQSCPLLYLENLVANRLNQVDATANNPTPISSWQAMAAAWNRFWFAPTSAETLAIIRIGTGGMLAYIHLIWLANISDFFGPNALIDREAIQALHAFDYTFSYLRSVESIAWLTVHQTLAMIASLCVASGLLTRIALPLAWFMTLNTCHRATGYLFGLDQTVMMLVFGLIFSRCGSLFSVDAWLRDRIGRNRTLAGGLQWLFPQDEPHPLNTFASRLIQIHLCIVYLFGGLGKMRGGPWWDGAAIWMAAASYEYQSVPLTWIGRYPVLCGLVSHVTIAFETFYCVAIWPLRSRVVFLLTAVAVHLGIAIFLGMITFGLMMIVANLIFVPATWTAVALRRHRDVPVILSTA